MHIINVFCYQKALLVFFCIQKHRHNSYILCYFFANTSVHITINIRNVNNLVSVRCNYLAINNFFDIELRGNQKPLLNSIINEVVKFTLSSYAIHKTIKVYNSCSFMYLYVSPFIKIESPNINKKQLLL